MEVARAGAAGEYDSPWRDWDDEELDREFAPWPHGSTIFDPHHEENGRCTVCGIPIPDEE